MDHNPVNFASIINSGIYNNSYCLDIIDDLQTMFLLLHTRCVKLEEQSSKCLHISEGDMYVFADEQHLLPDLLAAISQLQQEDDLNQNCVDSLTGLACYFTYTPCLPARGMPGCSVVTCQDSNCTVCVVRVVFGVVGCVYLCNERECVLGRIREVFTQLHVYTISGAWCVCVWLDVGGEIQL